MGTLTLTPLTGIPLIRHGDNLADVVVYALQSSHIAPQDNDVLVLAQKIVSKAEGRAVSLRAITPSEHARELASSVDKDARLVELILRESRQILRAKPGTLIVEHKLGFVCANAGIDHSNVAPPTTDGDEWVLLLPEAPDHSAERLRQEIERKTQTKLGILIIDSHGRAWRNGTVGAAIGVAGLPALQDLRGEPDLFGFKLRITQVGTADELAAAASLVMGQAAEGTPVVHVRGFPYPLRESSLGELLRPREQDLFR